MMGCKEISLILHALTDTNKRSLKAILVMASVFLLFCWTAQAREVLGEYTVPATSASQQALSRPMLEGMPTLTGQPFCGEYRTVSDKTPSVADSYKNSSKIRFHFYSQGVGVARIDDVVEAFRYQVNDNQNIAIQIPGKQIVQWTFADNGSKLYSDTMVLITNFPGTLFDCWKTNPSPPGFLVNDDEVASLDWEQCRQIKHWFNGCPKLARELLLGEESSKQHLGVQKVVADHCRLAKLTEACQLWVIALKYGNDNQSDFLENSTGQLQTSILDKPHQSNDSIMVTNFYSNPSQKSLRLSSSTREQLIAACARQTSYSLCEQVAELFWLSSYNGDALRVLVEACEQQLTVSDRCTTYRHLVKDPVFLQPGIEQLTAMPCATFRLVNGLQSEWNVFGLGDEGRVTLPQSHSFARLENGVIHVRNQDGGDFILGRKGQFWLGLDMWTQFNVYEAVDVRTDCRQPKKYKRVDITVPQSYFASTTATLKKLCASNDIRACYLMGSQELAAGRIQQATDYFQRACTQNVVQACEALMSIYQRMKDDNSIAMDEKRSQGRSSKIRLPLQALKKSCAIGDDQLACQILALEE